MDQIRTALAWLKRQHFWVLLGLAPLIAIACWYLATGALTADFTKNQNAIKTEFDAASAIQAKAFKPNEKVNTLQQAETKKLADGVMALWTSLYDRQKEQVLRWPAQLSQGFTDYVASKKFGDPIRDTLRSEYGNYIKGRFTELVEIVKAVPIPDEGDAAVGGGRGAMMGEMMGGGRGGPSMGGGRGGMMEGGMGGGMAAMGGAEEVELPAGKIVDWLADDQARLKAELQPPRRPSALQIWVTQENLWVYETILRAIANTNEAAGADRNGNAAVRKIYSMLVGNMAKAQGSQSGTRIFMPEVSASPGGMEGEMGMEGRGEMGMEGGGEMMGERGMEGEGMGGGDGDETQMLLGGRYLDAEGKPLPVAGGGGDVAADPMADPAASGGGGFDFGTEYKRLPVSLTLQVDQRWLSRLIVELANAPLQIEVQEVRVEPQGDTGGGGAMGGRGGGGMGPMGMGGGAAEVQFFDRQPHVKNVILQGIVYIFNPPDEALLSVDEEGSEGETAPEEGI